jgi:hypothetical protein
MFVRNFSEESRLLFPEIKITEKLASPHRNLEVVNQALVCPAELAVGAAIIVGPEPPVVAVEKVLWRAFREGWVLLMPLQQQHLKCFHWYSS